MPLKVEIYDSFITSKSRKEIENLLRKEGILFNKYTLHYIDIKKCCIVYVQINNDLDRYNNHLEDFLNKYF